LWFQSEWKQDNGYELKAQVIYLNLKEKNKCNTWRESFIKKTSKNCNFIVRYLGIGNAPSA